MNKKVMATIKSEKGRFLLLKTNPEHMRLDIWYVVTGSVEGNESDEEAVRREVQEETGLEITDIKSTDLAFEYEWPEGSGKMHAENAYLVLVKEATVKLSEWEHTEFKWLSKEDFIKGIDWFGDKKELIKIIASPH